MINFKETRLPNGLTVLAHRDGATGMAAVNMVYRVGARDENPSHTGFAHLFEHLMFRGTRLEPHFDIPVQQAAGENNAFTNNDFTDYYITLPRDNVRTALWLEADRMTGLDISPEALETEKKVVIEEFNQRYLNQPYGDQWLLLRELAYKRHPYRWATIGMTPDHVASATHEQVRAFYDKFYTPSNAILSVAGNIDEQEVFALAEEYFGAIPSVPAPVKKYDEEPPQTSARRLEVERTVPAPAVTIAFHMGERMGREFHVCDMISDLLGGGTSARLHENLVKQQQIFSGVNAYVTGDIDPGLIILTGHLSEGITISEAEKALWQELEKLQDVSARELEKVKNKFEANTLFGELNVMNKAMNLGYYKMLGDMELLNGEVAIQRSITAAEIAETAAKIFTPENSSTLIYHAR